jgi:ribosomal protein L28
MKGNQVPRGIGRRVTRRSIIKQMPNLRYKKIDIEGHMIRVRLCTSCLKRMNFEANKLLVASEVATA